MSDRGILFLFSLGVILTALGAAAWLIDTGQARYIDGLLLLICCLILAMAFGLYVKYLIKSAMQATTPPAAPVKNAANIQAKSDFSTQVAAKQMVGKTGESAKVLG
jgi:hypothetical protein